MTTSTTPPSPRPDLASGAATPAAPGRPWHTLAPEAVLAAFGSSAEGLSAAEAAARLAKHGPNELKVAEPISPWSILFDQLKNILIVILLIATLLSFFLGHAIEAVAIGVIVLFAVLLGFAQEYRAERAIEALREMAAPTASVIRDGRPEEIPARELVPGDLVELRAGDRIPADLRLLQAINLQVEEAALTGESLAVEKQDAALEGEALPIGDRRNMAYAGTAATYGRAQALVVATGSDTEFGRIAQMLQAVEVGRTPLQENLDRVGRMLAAAALVVVAVIVLLGLARGQPFIEMLIFGIALAVAVVPEALPAVVTISLAIGVQKMVKRNALMRRLAAVETLGSTSIICSDKTGTLTRDEMTVRQIMVGGRSYGVSGAGYVPEGRFSLDGSELEPGADLEAILRTAVLASDATLLREDGTGAWKIQGDPTEGALLVAAAKAGLHKAELEERYPRVAELPFTSETKRMITAHTGPAGAFACAKGAPEILVAACDAVWAPEGPRPLAEADREAVLAEARRMASQALRVLAIATRPGDSLEDPDRGMVLVGLIGMIDPPRPEAAAAIQTCREAGIKPVMITGDHPLTAEAVARELGLIQTGRIVTGLELEAMDEAAFEAAVESVEVYARVSPAHKLRVVTALQGRGHVVAMTGDGVNDAPALKKADIGIAMGITGTDVTKEAADMMLTDDNFASIVAAVEEGRGIFGNIKKYLMYLLSSNIGEIVLVAGSSLLGLPLPLTAVQILYVNLATDGLPALALAVDPPEPDLMRQAPRNPRTGIFTRPVVSLMMVGGLWSALVNLSLFAWALGSGRGSAEAMTMTFVSLVLIQFFKAYNFRSDHRSALHQPLANRWLNLAVGWEMVLLVLIVYLPFLHEPFGTFALTLEDWIIVGAAAVTILPVLELAKWMVRRGWFGKG